jgi:hypothetical protein
MTRKMQIFYTTVAFEAGIIIFSIIKQVMFTSDNLTNIILLTLGFSSVMAGANVGEWFLKGKMNGIKDVEKNNT